MLIDIEEFQRKIKNIKSLKFTSMDNLFSDSNLLSKAFKDYAGYNTDVDFTVEIKSKTPDLLDNIDVIRKIKRAIINQQISDLTIIGTDEKDFEQIFNQGTFNKVITIYMNENDEGLINPQNILSALLEKVSNV